MTSRLHLCPPARETVLLDELRATFPGSRHALVARGLLWSDLAEADAAATPCLAFAEQVLPAPEPIATPSVGRAAESLAEAVLASLDAHAGPWRLHVLSVERPAAGSKLGPGRARLVRGRALALIKERRRALHRGLIEDDRPFADDEALVQLLLVSLESAWLSVCGRDERRRLRRVLSRFPGGVADVPEDRRPPSRAYAKLLEAERHAGFAIGAGQTCVDLGGSPGGWSAIALRRGARVLAVDRAPLRADLMRHERLVFRRGDAFRFRPDAAPRGAEPLPAWLAPPVDWLLCDVIAFPERTLGLLRTWLERSWCRRFVVTVKFRGAADQAALTELKALLQASGAEFLVRQLRANKNEVTACGALPDAARSATAPSV